MKTLVNKANPAIRITAPEIEDAAVYGIDCKTLHSTQLYLFREDWTLVEEEPVDLEKETKKISFVERLREQLSKMSWDEIDELIEECEQMKGGK